MKSFKIASREVGPDAPPMIVAEMSGNHNRSLERALALVDAAAAAGAHALKLQTYTADTITLDSDNEDFVITSDGNPWTGRRLYDLYAEAHTPWDWHAPIVERARGKGLIVLSSPFDETAVDFLEGLDLPAYKIASFENNHLPLIRKAAATGKPLIISSGLATLAELDAAVRTAREAGCKDLILLKCTSAYPASPANSNLATIPHMMEHFDCQAGLSDHTPGLGAAVASVAFGVTLIEKHFTLDRAEGGVDSEFSLEPAELRALVEETERAWQAIGSIRYGASEAEESSRAFRRSIYFVRDRPAGHIVREEDIRIIRPGHGLDPAEFERIVGLPLAREARRGDAVQWTHFQGPDSRR